MQERTRKREIAFSFKKKEKKHIIRGRTYRRQFARRWLLVVPLSQRRHDSSTVAFRAVEGMHKWQYFPPSPSTPFPQISKRPSLLMHTCEQRGEEKDIIKLKKYEYFSLRRRLKRKDVNNVWDGPTGCISRTFKARPNPNKVEQKM